MTIGYQRFWDWLEIDEEEGTIIGIRKDAPQQMKIDYKNYLKMVDDANKQNIKL